MRLTLMALLFQCTRSIEMSLSPGDGPLNPIQANFCAAQNPSKPLLSQHSSVAEGSCNKGATFAQPTVPAGAVSLEKLNAMVSADSGASADLCYDVHEYRASSWEAWVRDNDSAKFDEGTFSVAPSYSVDVPFFNPKHIMQSLSLPWLSSIFFDVASIPELHPSAQTALAVCPQLHLQDALFAE